MSAKIEGNFDVAAVIAGQAVLLVKQIVEKIVQGTAAWPTIPSQLSASGLQSNRHGAIRAKVEHAFRVLKCQLGYRKVIAR
jgi:hypothetical protein